MGYLMKRKRKMTLRERQALFLISDAKLVLYAENVLKKRIVCIDWIRTKEQQKVMVLRKASKTMKSKHIDGLAKDYAFVDDLLDDGKLNYDSNEYKALGEFWESLGPDHEWGGRWGDNPNTQNIEGWDAGHFQYNG